MAHALLFFQFVDAKFLAAVALVALVAVAAAPPVCARDAPIARTPLALHADDIHGHPFDLAALRGQIVVVTFSSRRTMKESQAINQRLDELVMPGRVAVVTVVNLAEVPSLFLGYARRRVAEATANSRIAYLLDERGHLSRTLAVDAPCILVIDRAGTVQGRFRGQAELDGVLRAVAGLRESGRLRGEALDRPPVRPPDRAINGP